jgi:hypothetical protein
MVPRNLTTPPQEQRTTPVICPAHRTAPHTPASSRSRPREHPLALEERLQGREAHT